MHNSRRLILALLLALVPFSARADTQVLFASPQYGLTVAINYDHNTLVSTGFTVTLTQQLHATVVWFYTNASQQKISGAFPLNAAAGTYNAPFVTTGTSRTDAHGETVISWPFAPYGFSITPTP